MALFNRSTRDQRRARSAAAGVLDLARSVWRYRRDQLEPGESEALRAQTEELQGLLGTGAKAEPLGAAATKLEATLRRVGGAVYPKSMLGENAEFLLILAIVVLGIRSYFVQYFVIPTNSMWPTYNGMTPEVFPGAKDEPGLLRETARVLFRGAWPHRLDAPVDGEVLLPIGGQGSLGYVHCSQVDGRSWLVLPARERRYTLVVGGRSVTTQVPLDFDFDWAAYDAFFADGGAYNHTRLASALRERLQAGAYVDLEVDGQTLRCVRTGRVVRAGDRLLAFDEMAGDKVLVDRVSYQFVRPEVGSGFVFRTGGIPGIARVHGDTYYIKRLVGVPGDTLEVRGSTLMRNGSPIRGSEVFEKNARQQGQYQGYEASGLLAPGASVSVAPGNYFAMGDNSVNSGDSREWGFVPASEVVGRPLAVYYPLARWQAAH